MGKIFFYSIAVFLGVLSLVFIANSQNKTKSIKDVVSELPGGLPTKAPQSNLTGPSPTPTVPTPTITPIEFQGPPKEPKATISAVLKTTKGNITLTLFLKESPASSANFMAKAEEKLYNNLTFHRVEDWVVQGGDPKGNGTGGGQMQTEINNKPFVVGSVGVARGSDIRISNDMQFFIVKKEAAWLNGQYANFGVVTEGMDIVNSLKIGDKILSITVEEL